LETTGRRLTRVLEEAWTSGFSIQSNFYRNNAAYVALAASEGYITTIINKTTFGSIWRVTPEGCRKLFENRLYFSLQDEPHGTGTEPRHPTEHSLELN
jgi:hypothetical protein